MESVPKSLGPNALTPASGSTVTNLNGTSQPRANTMAKQSLPVFRPGAGVTCPTETAEIMLRSFILDYLDKSGLTNAATSLRAEISAHGQSLKHPPQINSTSHPFLFEWFSAFWDKFVHRARELALNEANAKVLAAEKGSEQSPEPMQRENIPDLGAKGQQPGVNGTVSHQKLIQQRQNLLRHPTPGTMFDPTPLSQQNVHRQPPRYPSTSNFHAAQPNPAVGVQSSAPLNSVGMASMYNVNQMTMFGNQNDMLKRTTTAGSHGGVGSGPQGLQPDHISVRSAPPNFSQAATNTGMMLNGVRGQGVSAVNQFRQGNVTGDFGQNQAAFNGQNGKLLLRRTASSSSAAFDHHITSTKRQRIAPYPDMKATVSSLPPETQAQLQQAVREVNLHADDRGVAGANAAAAVAAYTGRPLPDGAIPVRATRENGLIYLQGRDYKIWPGGHDMPPPSDPNTAEELRQAAEKAKEGFRKAQAHASQASQAVQGIAPHVQMSSAAKEQRDLSAVNDVRGSESTGNGVATNRRGLQAPDASSSQNSSSRQKVDAKRSDQMPGRAAAPVQAQGERGAGSEIDHMGPPASRKGKTDVIEREVSSGEKNQNTHQDVTDTMSVKSIGQESGGLSQRSSASGGSAKRTTSNRGRGKGRGRGRKRKDGEGGRNGKTGSASKMSPNAIVKRGKRASAESKKSAPEENGVGDAMTSNSNVDTTGTMAVDDKRFAIPKNHRGLGSEPLESNFGSHNLFGMLSHVHDGTSTHVPDGSGLDDALHCIPDGSRGVTQGLTYESELHHYLGDETDLGTFFTDIRGGIMDNP